MIEKNDWRLTNQLEYLYGKELTFKKYCAYNDSWDHDHCEFCSKKIVDGDKAFCTKDEYYWVCEDCFNDFDKLFKWNVIK